MKIKALVATSILAAASLLAGCQGSDGLTLREHTCLDHGGTWEECTREGRLHAERMARAENGQDGGYDNVGYGDVDYPPAEAGQQYTNYYGDPAYGHWVGGYYHFYNPYGMYAIQTNSYLLAAGLNGLASYIGTRAAMHSVWNSANPSGYHTTHYTSTKYIVRNRNGKVQTISRTEAMRRKAQSRKDRAAHKAKLRKQNKAKGKSSFLGRKTKKSSYKGFGSKVRKQRSASRKLFSRKSRSSFTRTRSSFGSRSRSRSFSIRRR